MYWYHITKLLKVHMLSLDWKLKILFKRLYTTPSKMELISSEFKTPLIHMNSRKSSITDKLINLFFKYSCLSTVILLSMNNWVQHCCSWCWIFVCYAFLNWAYLFDLRKFSLSRPKFYSPILWRLRVRIPVSGKIFIVISYLRWETIQLVFLNLFLRELEY